MNEVLRGNAMDGFEYYTGSPEVEAYCLIYPEINLDVALGTVLSIHNLLARGMEPALPVESEKLAELEAVIGMIRKNLVHPIVEEVGEVSDGTGEEPVIEEVEIAPQIEVEPEE